MRTTLFALVLLLPVQAVAQTAERQVIVTISATELKGGVVSEIAWDKGALILQGVFANPDGSLSAQYLSRRRRMSRSSSARSTPPSR